MHRRSGKGLRRVAHKHRDIDVVNNINWDWAGNRDGDRDSDIHSLRVRDNPRHGDGHSDGHLHGDRSWDSLLNNDVIWLRNLDGDSARNTNFVVHSYRLRHTHRLNFGNGNCHRAVLDHSVWGVDVVLPGLDLFHWHRHLDFLHHILHHIVGLWYSDLLRNSLRLIHRDIDLVRDNLIDGNNYLNSIRYLHLLDNWHCLRDIDSLCLCDFDWIRNIHRDVDVNRHCNGLRNLDGLRHFDCDRDVVRTRNFARHLVWDNNLVWHSDLLRHRHFD